MVGILLSEHMSQTSKNIFQGSIPYKIKHCSNGLFRSSTLVDWGSSFYNTLKDIPNTWSVFDLFLRKTIVCSHSFMTYLCDWGFSLQNIRKTKNKRKFWNNGLILYFKEIFLFLNWYFYWRKNVFRNHSNRLMKVYLQLSLYLSLFVLKLSPDLGDFLPKIVK